MKTVLQSASIPKAFKASARKFGDRQAIQAGPDALCYRELDVLSDRLAARLVGLGVQQGARVGLSARREIGTIVGMLGILKAGAGYVPLPDHYPGERLQRILSDAGITLAVGPEEHLAVVTAMGVEAVAPVSDDDAEAAVLPEMGPEDLAYVMFTSGSTGVPKGVMVPQRAVLRLVQGQDFMSLGPDERILQYAPMAFDAATLEIWGALLNGGTLVLPPEGQLSLRELGECLQRERITTIWLTAGLFHAMADERPGDFAGLQQLLTGGDVVSPVAVGKVMAACPQLKIINGYGPTENTTFTCCHTITQNDIARGEALPIGKPIRGTQVYVTDADLNPVADGTEGELCAAGEGLALGYLGQPELTAEKFVAAPWNPDIVLYRTGDLVRRDENGVIRFLGRADAQVKLRGYRVELGEVETAMQSAPGVRQAVALARAGGDGADRMLVGYYVPGAGFDADALTQVLQSRLPAHAVPARLIALSEIPLNANGKADRKALAAMPLPARVDVPVMADANTPDLEDGIAAHLADVLALPNPDRQANFFDLGASSLHLARVHERVQRDIGREFGITDLFQHSTIRALARHLATPETSVPAIVPKESRATDGLIAIVGMAGRFPGARDVETFWQGLLDGREMISQFSAEELDFDPRAADPDAPYVLARGVMENSVEFDARHFGIPPREAERLDPQHRVLLEVAQTALENAGHDPDRFAGRIGIFAGSSQNSYLLNNLVSAPGAARALAAGYPVKDFATLFGNDKDFIATRIAYKLNLRGPAVTVQCACSTSLVAVGQACDALRRGQADMALAGGVSITFPARRPYLYTPDGMASADGHCRTFDAQATGTVFGDGAALVVLRRLEDALADGDEIYAVIRGHAINNDGSDKAGYAAPSIRAQAEVIRAAHLAAGVQPADIGYVEAHGTGTPLGDPIEFAALQQAFGPGAAGTVALGTAKTNVGHLDIAAGVTGLIKAALTLKHGEIPPLLHYESPNPNINFAASPFVPVAQRKAWGRGDKVRRAGVSAFGVGGTNIHMVLEEAPLAEVPQQTEANGPVVFPMSASSPDALAAMAKGLSEWAATHPEADPRQVAATLRAGRRHYPNRAVLVADGMEDLARVAGEPVRASVAGRADRIAFLFPGQGAQHFGMGRDLYENAPVFRAALDECAEWLAPDLGVNLLEILHGPESAREDMTARLKDTAIAQPAIFSFGYALARQWADWGITPDIMLGHSIGELAAATIAGVIDLPDALHLIALRGRLMADLPGGVMLSVRASEAEIRPYLNASLDLAAVNGPRACVLAGPEDAAVAIIPVLEAAGLVTARLHTSHAFHSHMMEPAVAPFRAAVAKLSLRAPNIPILSTVTGDWMTAQEATDPNYWAGHMRRPVRFLDALQGVWSEGRHLMIETGPGRTLSTLAAQNPDRDRLLPAIPSLPHAQATDASSHRSMLEAFGLIWANGMPVDWSRLGQDAPKARGLPTYPFQRKTFWVEPVDALPGLPAPEAVVTDVETPLADAPATADALREMLSELSGIEPNEMPGKVSFLGLGFDSLLLTQATRELSDRFGVSVSLRELIDGYATIDALAAHIDAVGTAKPKPGAKPAVAENDGSFVAAPVPDVPVSAPVTRIKSETEVMTPRQQAHIDALVARYTAKTKGSKALTARYRPTHADPRTASGFNRAWKEIVYQIVTVKSKGSRLLDVDGNEYIDLLNGFGPGFLGHSAPPVVAALRDQLDAGYEVGPQSLVAMEAAELFCRMTGNDRASFVCTGSEAVYAAMRLARTVTARDRIVMFARDYHGNFDEVLVRSVDGKDGPRTLPLAPGIPRDSVKNVIVLPYGTPQSLDWIRANASTLAAVIIEPVQSRRPEFRPVEFVREVRRITENAGALMIFDEVVTGFRFGPRGAQGYYNVTADLVTYGKVVGGGMPVGVVSGKAKFMDTFDGGQWAYGDDSFPQAPVTFFAGTFVRHPLAMAAVRAMLTHLMAQPDFFWQTVNSKGDRLAGTVDRWFADNDMPFQMPNCGSLMYLRIAEDQPHGALIGAHLRDRGVFLLEGFPSYMTAAHDDADINHAIAAFKDAALEMRAGGMLTGRDIVDHVASVDAVPPRLTLPGGEAKIDAAMSAPLGPITVPTTEAQREIWAAMIVTPELGPAYNESVTLRMRGPIDLLALKKAVQTGLERHDAFRATFSEDGSEMQVQPVLALPVNVVDLTGQPASALAQLLDAEMEAPFDMQAGPFVRARIVVLGPDSHDLILTAHHIVCDGWSIDVVMRDIGAIYTALVAGVDPELPPVQSILDFARAEADWSRSPAAAEDAAYWLDRFRELGPVLDLPADHPRGPVRGVRGARRDARLPEPVVAALRALAKAKGVSFVNLMLAAWKVHIARQAGVSDVTIGLPAAGQSARGMPQVVGHCVNLLPIRSQIDWTKGFDHYLGQVRDALLDAYDHQNHTYGALVRALKLPRDPSRVMLVPVIFNIDKGIDLSGMAFGEAKLEFLSNPRRYEHFDLFLNVTDKGSEVLTEWSYKADLFEPDTIDRQVHAFEALLGALAGGADRPMEQVLQETAATAGGSSDLLGDVVDYPAQETLDSLFLSQAQRTPQSTALIDTGQPVTYAQLDARSVDLARHFVARGVTAGDTLAICLDRSADMVAAMLAAMRLGAPYVPLDPSNPVARLAYVIEDSQAKLVLTSKALQDRFGLSGTTLLEDLTAEAAAQLPDLPTGTTNPQGVAYVAYTSGSTGQPKGVMGSHQATVNRFAWMWRSFPFEAGEVMCQKTSISFVDSVWEIFGPLLAGVPQVILDRDTAMDPQRLLAQMHQHRVSRLLLVPSLLKAILDAGLDISARVPSLRLLFVSGETLPGTLARDFLKAAPGIRLVNLYGSSEVTADVTCEEISCVQGTEVPIGLPIDNVRLYILDQNLRPVPRGQSGLLYVGGDALAAGYLHRPDLTAERFVPDPFADQPDARMFATGDRVRQRADGRLMYEGRADQQVKIRGNRVELGEVEAALAALPEVAQAVVLAKTAESGDVHLAAYVTARDLGKADGAILRRALALTLPDYMIPAEFQTLGELPLNTSGKIDRLALAKLPSARHEAAPSRRMPATEAERDIHRLWMQILNSDDIGVDDNFFELGGHSLLAVKLFSGLRKTYGVDLPISTLFAHPTIRSLAEAVTIPPKPDTLITYSGAPEDSPWDTSVVIAKGPETGGSTLFVVGGVGGNVNNLQELGRVMDPKRRVVGLQTRGVLGHRMHATIEAMASEHIEHIRRHQPEGPYLIAGYSGGSFTAFEIARQFEAMGQKVQFLGILDMFAPIDVTRSKATLGERLGYEVRNFAKHGPRVFLSRLRPWVHGKVLSGPVLDVLSKLDPDRHRLTRLAQNWLQIAQSYRPAPYDGDIWLLMTPPEDRKSQELMALDPEGGWGKIVKGERYMTVLDANHLGMLSGQNAVKVADWLESNIAATAGAKR